MGYTATSTWVYDNGNNAQLDNNYYHIAAADDDTYGHGLENKGDDNQNDGECGDIIFSPLPLRLPSSVP